MKKAFRLLFLAGLIIAGFASCSKDGPSQPNKPKPGERPEEQVFWNVVGQLVGMDQATPDYKGKTFTPTIGSPDNGDESVRIVAVNSLIAAVGRYNTLTGASIDPNTASYTWNDPNIGTLTWNKGDGSTCWGTVDVAIPSVPSLSKIIYRSPEQGDTNGSVGDNGSAYYRFGDVISRTRPADKKGGTEFPAITEYWVCVRPAFDLEGKGDSHWVSLSPLPRENVWPYNDDDYNYGPYVGSNKYEYGAPTELGNDLEWLQDLNEMLYAIVTAGNANENWYNNANNYYTEGWFGPDGLLIFNDFHKDRLQYHNDYFWQNVKSGWAKYDIFNKIFGSEYGAGWIPGRVMNGGKGISYLHTGYSWWTWWENDLTVYEATYKSVVTGDHLQLNMHGVEKREVDKQVTNPDNTSDAATNIKFNVFTECSVQKPYIVNEKFFGDSDPRFIYRYKTGEELAKIGGGKWDPQFQIPGFTEVYRYYGNGEFVPNKILIQGPEITDPPAPQSIVVDDPAKQDISSFVGDSYYKVGDVYRDQNRHRWFVSLMSGHENGDKTPYTELISFDGIETGADGVYGTNLPTRNQAIHGTIFLWNLANNGYKLNDNERNSDAGIAKNIFNILDYAGVDVRRVIQILQSTSAQARDMPACVSVAYKDGSTDKQRLMRFVCDITISPTKMPTLMFWDHYPSEPYLEAKLGTSFSTDNIYLQDVNDQAKVNKYANDMYAKQNAWVGGTEFKSRSVRTQTEPKAAKFSNYIYNKTYWNAFEYPTEMWNAPVLAFRITRIYDRGNLSHASKTVDGLTLELDHARTWGSDKVMSEYEEERVTQSTLYITTQDDLYMDGKKLTYPDWTKWNE